MKKAAITGISGQDGAYLAKNLLAQGYEVIGLVQEGRRSDLMRLQRLNIVDKLIIESIDLCSVAEYLHFLVKFQVDEVYCLAAASQVWASWQTVHTTLHFNITSISSMLEAVVQAPIDVRVFIALSSEIFGDKQGKPIEESTAFAPQTPYAVSKAATYWLAHSFREKYGLYVACGYMFNHESALRAEEFVIKKIIAAAFRIRAGEQAILTLGNTAASRDFGYAPEYMQCAQKMLQQEIADDYVVATGISMKIQDVVEIAFQELGISTDCLRIDNVLLRANEAEKVVGKPDKAKHKLAWQAEYSGKKLIQQLMRDYESMCIKQPIKYEAC